MAFLVVCFACGEKVNVADDASLGSTRCPKCGQNFAGKNRSESLWSKARRQLLRLIRLIRNQ
jgi:DNA-directed RNA polymerase subunit RPC12/RpoP